MPEYDARETSASRRAHRPEVDPRDIVTEYAFRVDPDLLGVPLAGAFRRIGAMLTDLVLLAVFFPFKAILDELLGGVTDLLVAALAAWVLWRLGEERQEPSLASHVITWAGRAGAAVVFLLAAITFVTGLFAGGPGPPAEDLDDLDDVAAVAAGPGGSERAASDVPPSDRARPDSAAAGDGEPDSPTDGSVAADSASDAASRTLEALDLVPRMEMPRGARLGGVDLDDLLAATQEARALGRATSPEEARPAADRLALRLQRMGVRPARIEEALRDEIVSEADGGRRAWMTDVVRRAVTRAESASAVREARGDSLLALWSRARSAGDTARARELRPELLPLVAGDSLRALRNARAENREMEARIDELTTSEGFLRRFLDRLLDDLGLGFGSAALFFTVFLRLDRGRTPGKRLFGVRVVRLNGERLSWWDAFSRFGGYFVGLFTGFLGWLQVFWDPNRQAIHDRIAGTVAIRIRGPGKRY